MFSSFFYSNFPYFLESALKITSKFVPVDKRIDIPVKKFALTKDCDESMIEKSFFLYVLKDHMKAD